MGVNVHGLIWPCTDERATGFEHTPAFLSVPVVEKDEVKRMRAHRLSLPVSHRSSLYTAQRNRIVQRLRDGDDPFDIMADEDVPLTTIAALKRLYAMEPA